MVGDKSYDCDPWYRGYTRAQLDAMIGREQQQQMPVGFVQMPGDEKEASELRAKMNVLMEQARATFVPFRQQPPALFSQEQLEQIRTVMREELAGARKLSADDIPPDAVVMSGEELAKKLKKWKPVIQMRDTSVDAIRWINPRKYDSEIEGQGSVTAELEHQGKLYSGVLHFVKDIEK